MKNVKRPPISEILTDNKFEYERIKEIFGNEEIEVIYKKSADATEYVDLEIVGWGFYQALNQRTYAENGIICDQDVPVKMRDGVTIYIDIYRPERLDKVPAIVSWGFYGKRPGDIPKTWQVLGVPPKTISKMAKFESPDPGYWVKQGYAVINVDSRRTGNSVGKLRPWQKQDAEDGYDLIEWLATQRWCSGKIADLSKINIVNLSGKIYIPLLR
ncbi:CocE/NonD family hydrolase [Anaerocolumna sp. MB42-C2]|uniref:CocE/NonD family hydrolase n=1 Tax=Anaerocolumna sp. MB42-C2 TaxID=3070997 RepID=UPI0027DEEEA4|nr:CocE/NonD family hydrolase [Anaerocolumna sp. MB42-C2]WMJ86788.1 CocE/NonD family hydrolase [Anaerocolumna sp. MB42-C2]